MPGRGIGAIDRDSSLLAEAYGYVQLPTRGSFETCQIGWLFTTFHPATRPAVKRLTTRSLGLQPASARGMALHNTVPSAWVDISGLETSVAVAKIIP